VAELGQQRGSSVRQALDVHRLPQRARGVERRLQRQLGEVEQLAQRAGGGQRDPAQVVVEVEVGITTQRGGVAGSGGITTFCRILMTTRLARSIASRSRPQSAGPSRISRFRNAERVAGYASRGAAGNPAG
jgi:hypothetical protein